MLVVGEQPGEVTGLRPLDLRTLLLGQRVGPDRGDAPPPIHDRIERSELEGLASPRHGPLKLGLEQCALIGSGLGERCPDIRAGTLDLRRRHAHPPSIHLPDGVLVEGGDDGVARITTHAVMMLPLSKATAVRSEVAVALAAMSSPEHENHKFGIFDGVNDSVVSDADAP